MIFHILPQKFRIFSKGITRDRNMLRSLQLQPCEPDVSAGRFTEKERT